jgi:hypothetical protein
MYIHPLLLNLIKENKLDKLRRDKPLRDNKRIRQRLVVKVLEKVMIANGYALEEKTVKTLLTEVRQIKLNKHNLEI